MSEYQRYEFMTSDRPLTRGELEAVRRLSSHIDVSSSHAQVEYEWGDFKRDPIQVLEQFFDGFLYWANWGAPRLGFRFPRGVLPANLLDGYDLDEFVAFSRKPECDILDIHFGEMEGPDEWVEYDLGSLMPLRDELMDGDLRALYIVWMAALKMTGAYDEEESYEVDMPSVPPGFGKLTAAQQALAELLQVPQELLRASGRHSAHTAPSTAAAANDIAELIALLPEARRLEYLSRLARNEPGLSRLFITELRGLRPASADTIYAPGERIPFATLLVESDAIRQQMEREQQEREQRARQQRMQAVYDQQDDFWRQATQAAERSSGYGYDGATKLLVELRAVAEHFGEAEQFQRRFRDWVAPTSASASLRQAVARQRFPATSSVTPIAIWPHDSWCAWCSHIRRQSQSSAIGVSRASLRPGFS